MVVTKTERCCSGGKRIAGDRKASCVMREEDAGVESPGLSCTQQPGRASPGQTRRSWTPEDQREHSKCLPCKKPGQGARGRMRGVGVPPDPGPFQARMGLGMSHRRMLSRKVGGWMRFSSFLASKHKKDFGSIEQKQRVSGKLPQGYRWGLWGLD